MKALLLSLLVACAADPTAVPVDKETAAIRVRDPRPGPCSFLAADAPLCCSLACANPERFRAECAPPPGSCAEFACPLSDGSGFEEPAPALCSQ